MITERKPLLKKKPSKKFKMHEFQREDLSRLIEQDSSANFSEMGAMKTTTAEWLWQNKLRHIPNPRVLVITTKSGKGTYYESLPEVLPDWDVYTVSTKRNQLVIGSKPVPVDVKLPNPLYMRPVVVVAHYNCFSNRSCLPKPVVDKETGRNIINEDGTFEMTTPRCMSLLTMHWDMIVVDEAHRMKDMDTQWTRNIKKLKTQYKHIMTGTGFVNNPSELWSLLNFLYPTTYASYWKFREKYCNTPDAPIWMSDLSFKSLGDVEVGDKVVGWETAKQKQTTPGYGGERKLCESEVLAVRRRNAPVVRVTMKSGRQIKCTPDHLWLSGRGKGSIDRFVSVDGGRPGVNEVPQLVRIIDPTPELVGAEKQYAAAYLGAAMDCEGTWPILAQSLSYNPEVHARMVECVEELGFSWQYSATKSKIRINGLNGKEADEYIGGGAPANVSSLERNFAARQRTVDFLNWCNPAKKNRIINSVLGKGRWRLSDEVATIELLGVQEVVSMTTTTGNYVAWGYASKNCEEEVVGGFRKIVGIKPENEDEFRDLVRTVGVRRTMLECFPGIKEPIETEIKVPLNPIQRKMYDEILKDLHTMDQQGVPLHSPNVLSMLNRLRQISVATPEVVSDEYDYVADRRIIKVKLRDPSAKLDAAMEIIDGLEWDKERKDQVVVFSAFRDPLTLLKTRLDKSGIKYLHLHAEMNEKERYQMWHEEWPKKEHRVFLCTLAVGSESINLTSAHRAIFLDQSWSPAQNKQAIGRIYRPGQTEVAQLIYIRAENTVDSYILDKVETKHSWFVQVFGIREDEAEAEADNDE